MLLRLAAFVLMAGSSAFAGTITIVTEDVNGPFPFEFRGMTTVLDSSVLESFEHYPIWFGTIDAWSIEQLLQFGSPISADIPITVSGTRSVFRLFLNIAFRWAAWLDFYNYDSPLGVPLHFYGWYIPNRDGMRVVAYAVPEQRSETLVLGGIALLLLLKRIRPRVSRWSRNAG